MNTDAIYAKYDNAPRDIVDQDGTIYGQTIALALRLAIQETADANAALVNDMSTIIASLRQQGAPDQRVAESAINQIGRLTEWLAEEEQALCADNNLDTAAAILKAIRCRDHDLVMARRDLQAAVSERDGLRQQLAQMDADNADLTKKLAAVNGKEQVTA